MIYNVSSFRGKKKVLSGEIDNGIALEKPLAIAVYRGHKLLVGCASNKTIFMIHFEIEKSSATVLTSFEIVNIIHPSGLFYAQEE